MTTRLFRRLYRVAPGRIEAFLRKVEDPELVFPVVVREPVQSSGNL